MLRACLLVSIAAGTANAQSAEPLELDVLRQELANPERYTITVDDDGLTDEMSRGIADLIAETIGQDHFHGAAAAYLPAGSTELSFSIYANHHTLASAETGEPPNCFVIVERSRAD